MSDLSHGELSAFDSESRRVAVAEASAAAAVLASREPPQGRPLLGPPKEGASNTPRWHAAYASLPSEVQAKLTDICSTGVLNLIDLDERSITELGEFPANCGVDVLEQFSGQDLVRVRNKNAFLNGIMSRVRKDMKDLTGRYDPQVQRHNESGLPLSVQTELDRLVALGKVNLSDLDKRCLDFLHGLPPEKGVRSLEQYAAGDLSTVRNKPAFFMSVCRRIQRGRGDEWDGGSHLIQDPHSKRTRYDVDTSGAQLRGGYGTFPGDHRGGLVNAAATLAAGYTPAQVQQDLTDHHHQQQQLLVAAASAGVRHQPFLASSACCGGSGGSGSGVCDYERAMGLEGDQRAAQRAVGVRCEDLSQRLSPPHAHKLDPMVALLLQQQVDSGVLTSASFDDQAWSMMLSLRPQQALAVLREVISTLRSDPQRIRNPPAFFMRLAKMHLNGQMHIHSAPRPPSSSGAWRADGSVPCQASSMSSCRGVGVGGAPSEADWRALPPAVADALNGALGCVRGLSAHMFDARALQALANMNPATAIRALEELHRADLGRVRNFGAYFMGICRKVQDGTAPPR